MFHIYKSCGHSQCPVCQSIKREQWIDKLQSKLLNIPYVHIIFTLPHQIHPLARRHRSLIYSILMRAAWRTVKEAFKSLHALPGMTSILHTFGSDMKYHVHLHALVTFGGLNDNSHWVYPHHENKIASFRSICASFRHHFLQALQHHAYLSLSEESDILKLIKELSDIRWVVHTTRPTMNTSIIRNYLGRYINRIAITNNRLKYLEHSRQVALLYNDYSSQRTGCPAPKAIRHMHPLTAIQHIVQHVLPKHFQKSRSYGLHHPTNQRKHLAPDAVKAHPATVRTTIKIITDLIKHPVFQCETCGHSSFLESVFPPKRIRYAWQSPDTDRAPPESNAINMFLPSKRIAATHPLLS